MENMARQRRNSRRSGCHRNRRQQGGDGMAYSINGTVTGQHVINNYDGAVNRFPSCEDASRPGYLTGAAASVKGGLPGFAGGRRSASSFADLKGGSSSGFKGGRRSASGFKGGRRSASGFKGGRRSASSFADLKGGSSSGFKGGRSNSTMKGGRYSFVPEVVGGVGMMMPRYSGCGSGLDAVQNPLNQGNFPASVLTAPPPHVPAPTPMVGGVGGVDSMVYEAPRSGYTTVPSDTVGGLGGVLADGKTPFLLNVPYSAQPMPSAACLKTGGGSRKNRKGSRKNRKNRNRKSRKNRRTVKY
jgi:hypothetical protein